MKYTIWRLTESGEAFPLYSLGETTSKEKALEKARKLNEKLKSLEPHTNDKFVVFDENRKMIKDTLQVI